MVRGEVKRSNNFKSDPLVSSKSASPSDYKYSGYHKGHLAPAGDMKISSTAMNESFYMSNMSPQDPSFNTGIWRSLEMQVRSWANDGSLFIVTGGVLEAGLEAIGANQVAIPKRFYKVIYSPSNGSMIGFLIPNKKGDKKLEEFAIEIDKIELLTGLDFFSQLPDDLENRLEGNLNITDWSFVLKSTSRKSKELSTNTFQCRGKAKSTGRRCQNKTSNENKFCHHHQDQARWFVNPKTKNAEKKKNRCIAKTKRGERCSRSSSNGSQYCWQHQ